MSQVLRVGRNPRKSRPLEEEFKDSITIEWLKSQNKTTLKTYKYAWKLFLEFTKKNGSELLELRKNSTNGEIKKLILDFRNWLINEKGKSENSAKTCVMAVLGFFSFYELPVRFTRGERTTELSVLGEKAKIIGLALKTCEKWLRLAT